MGFKLGKASQPVARGGNINKKLSFKTYDASVSGNPVIRKKLDEGILGEANMDGSIFISDEIAVNSPMERQVLLHEMRHATDMKLGKLAYNDDSVYYDGVTYPRETINGKDMIKVDGKWKEAGDDFPWERTANI
tara:strand:- start:518 stop:919 length:402 start_codon:yes stop_codon:yes gene_type:complete